MSVLDGGLPTWISNGHSVVTNHGVDDGDGSTCTKGYEATRAASMVCDFNEICRNVEAFGTPSYRVVVDARSPARYANT